MDIPQIPESPDKTPYTLERAVWIVALVNAAIAAGTAVAFGRSLAEVGAAATVAATLGFAVVRLMVDSAWHEASEAHRNAMDKMVPKVTHDDTRGRLRVAQTALLKLSPPRLVVRNGGSLEVQFVDPERVDLIMRDVENS